MQHTNILSANPKQNKILFFSDLHLGVHHNSPIWHNIALNLAQWIRQVMLDYKLDTIIFAGDVFHDRHEIGVNTLHVAKKFFDQLSEFKIHIIPGNHDAFLSSTAEINSVEILQNSNVAVYCKPTTINFSGRKITFCPWKTNVNDIQEISDILVGHFELLNFKLNSHKICDHGEDSTELLEKSQAVITGHFHFRDHRVYDNKYVLYLGSPYEMDFGDRSQQKGVSIVDLNTLDVHFVENTITPKHYRLKISELVQKKYTNLPEIIKSNIISLYVDTKIDTLTLDLVIGKLAQYEPLQFRTEFNILDTAQVDTKEIKKLSIDIETAFHEFIEHVDTRATKKEVLDKCLELYKLCQPTHE